MENTRYTVSTYEARLLSRARNLRAYMWTHHADLAPEFARDMARSWKDSGLGGVASACFNLTLALRETVGGNDAYEQARDLAVALAACS